MKKKRIQYNFSGSLEPSNVLVILLPETQQSPVFIMAFSGTSRFLEDGFHFRRFWQKIRKCSLISGTAEDSETFVLLLRCYRNVKKSWSTNKMNEKMCCLVFTFSAKMSTLYSEKTKTAIKTCLYYEPPQPENAIMKTGLKRFAPENHRYDVCHCRHGLFALVPFFPSVFSSISDLL